MKPAITYALITNYILPRYVIGCSLQYKPWYYWYTAADSCLKHLPINRHLKELYLDESVHL